MALTIRRAQLVAMTDAILTPIVERISDRLRHRFSEELGGLADSDIFALVRRGIEAAGEYHITRECDVAQFVELLFAISPTMDVRSLSPRLRRTLEQFQISAETRLAIIAAQIALVPQND
jgi:hypothetical protein